MTDIVEIGAPKPLGTIPLYFETQDKRITDYLEKNIAYHVTHAALANEIPEMDVLRNSGTHITSGEAFDWEAPSIKFLRAFLPALGFMAACAWAASVWAS